MILWSKWVLDRTIGLSQLYFSHSLGSLKLAEVSYRKKLVLSTEIYAEKKGILGYVCADYILRYVLRNFIPRCRT